MHTHTTGQVYTHDTFMYALICTGVTLVLYYNYMYICTYNKTSATFFNIFFYMDGCNLLAINCMYMCSICAVPVRICISYI